MAKSNAVATAERVDHLQGMTLAGEDNTACLMYARQTWGVSRSQGYRLIKRAWRQIHDDIECPDLKRQEMLAWYDLILLEKAGQSKAQRNPGAVVAAYASLDWMCGLGIFLNVAAASTGALTEFLHNLHLGFTSHLDRLSGRFGLGG